jgi:5-methylcytosine-specific restriction protein A
MTKFSSPSETSAPQPASEAKPGSPSPRDPGNLSGRSVEKWVGSSPDAKIPPRVRARVFEAHGGICHISGRRIRAGEAWECDHVIALCNGGSHAESNLAPALSEPHRIKTKADVREKAKVARLKKRHLGIKKPRSIRAWRRFSGTAVFAQRER